MIARNNLDNLLVLVIFQRFYFYHFFHNFQFSKEITKSKSINLKSCFDTLIFKFSRFKMNFRIVFENFYANRWYHLAQKHQGHLWWTKIPPLIFLKYEILKRMENLAKNAIYSFTLVAGNFSNKHHYNLLKILRIFCFRYFCPKWLFPKLLALKVDLCIKVVALIKIMTVETKLLKKA